MRRLFRQAWLPALLLVLLGLMIWRTELATLAAGVGLFVLGIGRLEEGFRAFSGGALERWLKWSTSGLWKSLLVGVVSTALVQSSTLVTLLGIAFLSAGLINTLGGVGLVLGANLGTTTGAWLIALAGLKLNMAQLSMPMLAFGVFLARREETGWRGGGLALLGLGLLFLGIDLMKAGFSGFEGAFDLARYAVDGWAGVLLFVLIGALATVVMQSSHATLVLTLAALAAGQVQYDNALALVIGANLGSTATALFAGIGSNNAGRRIAATHLIFNLITAGAALLLLHQLMAAVEWLADVVGLAADAHMLKLAIFHTLYNVFGLMLVLPWSFVLVRLLERWLPDSAAEAEGRLSDQPHTRALYVNESALLHADAALKVLEQELQHLAQLSRRVIGAAVYLPSQLEELTPRAVHQAVAQPVPLAMRENADALYEQHIKGVYADIVDFMSRVDVSLLPEQQQAMLNASSAARDLVAAVKAAKHLQKNLRKHIDSQQPALREAYNRLREQCGLTLLELRDWAEAGSGPHDQKRYLEDSEARSQLFADAFQYDLQQQLRNRELDGWHATSLLNDLHYLLRIRQHLLRAHVGLGQSISTDDAQRLEQAVSLA